MKIYRYGHRQAIIVTCIVVVASLAIAALRGADDLEGKLLDTVVIAGMTYLLCYGYLLNTSFVVERDRLTVRRRIGSDRTVDFTEVRRFSLREKGGVYGFAGLQLTLYTDGGKVVMKLDGLSEGEEFIRVVERRVREAHGMERLPDLPDALRTESSTSQRTLRGPNLPR